MSPTGADTGSRRLVLSPTELELLRRRAGVTLPPDFAVGPDREVGGPEEREALAAAVEALARRRAARPDPSGDPLACEVSPSVLANLSVLAHPDLLLQTRARYGITSVHAAHAVAGPYSASLVRLDDRAVELSFFAPRHLGRELVRVVPEIPTAAEREPRPDALVRLEALEQVVPTFESGDDIVWRLAADFDLDPFEVAVVRALDQQLAGLLQCLVLGPPSTPGVDVRAGQVLWFATPDGWIGAAPEPGPQGERLVRLVGVCREDLGPWVAPLVGGALR
ncbi:MAG: ESX secretion-associated protein EspG [Egibacteraceae bacterium]